VSRVQVCVDLEERHYRALVAEADRRGVEVRSLVERMMQGLLDELEREERDGEQFPVIPS
jgi:hypothetical protein